MSLAVLSGPRKADGDFVGDVGLELRTINIPSKEGAGRVAADGTAAGWHDGVISAGVVLPGERDGTSVDENDRVGQRRRGPRDVRVEEQATRGQPRSVQVLLDPGDV